MLDTVSASADKPRQQGMTFMSAVELEKTIDAAFERREEVGPTTKGAVREAVDQASICSIAAPRASPSARPTAAGRSISG